MNIAMIIQRRLGDAIFHTPSLQWLRAQYPDARLDVFAPSELAEEVLTNNPWINHCYRSASAAGNVRYDLLLCAYDNDFSREIAAGLGVEVAPQPGHWHSSQSAARLLEYAQHALGQPIDVDRLAYGLFPGDAERQRINALLAAHQVPPDAVLIGCHIGCHGLAKRSWWSWGREGHRKVWSTGRYKRFLKAMVRAMPEVIVVLTGSGNEKRLTAKLRQLPKVVDLVGDTSVLELAALLERCAVFVTPDSGPLHVACAMPCHVIPLFGPTDPAIYGPPPGHDRHQLFRGQVTEDIPAEEVADAVLRALRNNEVAA